MSTHPRAVSGPPTVADAGAIPSWRLLVTGQPNPAETLTIGADIYQFDGAAPRIPVAIGADATATRNNLITAINGSGTEDVVADAAGGDMRVRTANAPGGAIAPAKPTLVLADAAANMAWDVGNIDVTDLAGRAPSTRRFCHTSVVVTAAMIVAGSLDTHFPFTIGSFVVMPLTAAGARRGVGADTYVAGADRLRITFGGGAAPDLQAGDVLHFTVWE